MIKIENLTKCFDGRTILDGLNLNVRKGSVYGLVGVNGSGKTTAIKHITGILRQDAGSVTIDGTPVYDNVAIKSMLGYIPDDLYFLPQYNMAMLRGFYRSIYPNWDDTRYNQLLSDFNLDPKCKLSRFSKGMQKQAAIVLVMSAMPEVLILDEPLDGLDPLMRMQVFHTIREDVAQRGLTVLVSSHNLKEMEGFCDCIGILKGGKMTIQRDLKDLQGSVHKLQLAFPQGTNSPDKYQGLDILHHETRGSVELLVVRGDAAAINSRIQALNPLICDNLPLSLEEVFIYENIQPAYATAEGGTAS